MLEREAMLEGVWYPDSKEELLEAIHESIPVASSRTATKKPARSMAVVVPFAPLDEIQHELGWAFAQLHNAQPKRIVLIGPCQNERRSKVIVPESVRFTTMLGHSKVDDEALQIVLESSLLVEQNDIPHLQENSLELALVYTHYFFPQIPVLPILLGDANEAVFRSITGAINLLRHELPEDSIFILCGNCSSGKKLVPQQQAEADMLSLVQSSNPLAVINAASEGTIGGESLIVFALATTLHAEMQSMKVRNQNLHARLTLFMHN